MRCEIKNTECDVSEMDCSRCEFARRKVKKVTEGYLRDNNVVIPNHEMFEETGVITTVWFQNPIAEIAKGVLQVAKHGL